MKARFQRLQRLQNDSPNDIHGQIVSHNLHLENFAVLGTSDHPLHPIKGAWRPFEHGPRSCIGQELAMLEMKVILVLTVRTFEIELVYEELDQQMGTKGVKTVYGERGYQIQRAQPSGDFPVRVRETRSAKRF